MEGNIIIRCAIEDDIPAMMALIRELAEFEKEPQAVTVTLAEFREAGFGARPLGRHLWRNVS